MPNDNTKKYEKPADEIGTAWRKSGAKGPYYSGYLEIDGKRIQIVMFPTGNKDEKQPAVRILKAKEQNAPAKPKAQEPEKDDSDLF